MDALTQRVEGYLEQLCSFPDRRMGGPGNAAATRLFAEVTGRLGFEVETTVLDCLDWRHGPSVLEADGERFDLHAGPYSPPLTAEAPLAVAETLEELESGDFGGRILLLRGELTRHQLMPKDFPFYTDERSVRIIGALERSRSLGVVAATGRDPGLAGGAYPFPLLEDGGFDLPNAYLTDVDGVRLERHARERVRIALDSAREDATCEQVVARKPGSGAGRLVLCAHIDSKPGTPGALDNASGVASLLGAAELLAERRLSHTVELVPFNGEDDYSVAGQLAWLAANKGRLGDVRLALNVDGAGFVGGATAVSLYGTDEALSALVRKAAAAHAFVEGPQWPQGDHMILVMQGVPAVALTSENAFFVTSTVAHTAKDTLANVDTAAIAEVARFLADVATAADS